MTSFVPCPACGGPVHPIAGRCKHCKTDLNKVRDDYAQAQRAASMGMPRPIAAPPPAGPGAPTMQSPTLRAPTPAPLPQPAQVVYPGGYGTAVGSSWSRRWPLLVGGAAVVVIAISLIVLFRGNDSNASTNTTSPSGPSRSPRPIPDDMNPQGPLGRNTPIPPDLSDPNRPQPPDPDPRPNPFGQRTQPRDVASFATAMIETLCERVNACGVTDPGAKMMCSALPNLGTMLDPGALGGSGGVCTLKTTAVDACISAIENISCDTIRSNDIGALLSNSALNQCTDVCEL
jgi:hypothetical protein